MAEDAGIPTPESPPRAPDQMMLRAPMGPAPENPFLPAAPITGPAFRQVNPIVSVLNAIMAGSPDQTVDPFHNPLDLIRGTNYAARNMDAFLGSRNEAETRSIMARMDQEEEDRRALAAAGGWGTAAMLGAGLLDPTLAIPVGGAVRALEGGYSAGRTALQVGALSGLQASVSEIALQASQVDRPWQESAGNIATGTVLGAILGGGIARLLTRVERKALEDAFEPDRVAISREIEAAIPTPDGAARPIGIGPSSVGAADADARDMVMKGLLPKWITDRVPPSVQDKFEWLVSTSPTLRVFRSDNAPGKRAMADIVETVFRFEQNERGMPTAFDVPLDRLVKMQKADLLIQATEDLKSAWSDYRFGQNAPRAAGMVAGFEDAMGRSDKMSFHDFKVEVTRALMSGDTHAIPQVQQAAQSVRAKILDPTEKWLQKIGLLDEDLRVRGDPSWFSRVWNREKVAADRHIVADRFTQFYAREQAEKAAAKGRLEQALGEKAGFDAEIAKLEAVIERLDEREARIAGALSERASDVKRLDKRVDALSDRVELLKEESTDLAEFIGAMRQTVRDPAALARLDELENEARALAREEARVTPGLKDLVEMEARQADEVLSAADATLAADILTGKRKPFKVPSFARWVAQTGGVVDVGGDLASRLGGKKTPPGLVRKRPEMMGGGMFLGAGPRGPDAVGQDIRGEFSREFVERIGGREEGFMGDPRQISPDEVVEWITDSVNGREPDWWVNLHTGEQNASPLARATRLADTLGEALDQAGIDASRDEIAKLLAGQQGRLRFAEVDEALKRMQEMADQTAIQRTAVEDQITLRRDDIARARAAIEKAQARGVTVRGAISREGARANEAAGGARASRSRFDILRDQSVLYDIKRDITNEAIGIAQRNADDLRAKMEQEIRDWKGDSTADAISALKARDKASAGRAPDAPRLRGADKAVDRVVKRIIKSDRDMSLDELRARAEETIDRILSGPDGRLAYDAASGGPKMGPPTGDPPPRGSLNARNFAIPTAEVFDYVEHDTEHLLGRLLSTVLPDGMIHERFGDVEMREAFRKVNEDSAARAARATTEAERRKIEAERQMVTRDLAASRDRLRGIYGFSADPLQRNAARYSRIARNFNSVTDLGTAAPNSMGDMAGIVWRYGLSSTFGDAWRPFVTGLAQGGDAFTGAAKRQAKAAQIAVETQLNLRAHAISDVLDNYRPNSKFDRGMAWAADKMQLANGQAPFTDAVKTVAATVVAADILRMAERVAGGKASAKELADLAARNIGRADAEAIWAQFAAGGGDVIDGVRIANTADWTNARARRIFEGALNREVDIAVVTPGAERPLILSQPIVGLLGQFKSFIAATHERTLLAQMQQRDGRTLAGLASSIAFGILSYRLYTLVAEREFDTNPSQLVKEGLSRGGGMGWLDDINAIAAKGSRGYVDMYRLVGAGKPLSRYESRSVMASFFGPTYGKVEGAIGAGGAALAGDFNASNTSALRRLIPAQNLFYLRNLLNEAERDFNDLAGIPQRAPPGPPATFQ